MDQVPGFVGMASPLKNMAAQVLRRWADFSHCGVRSQKQRSRSSYAPTDRAGNPYIPSNYFVSIRVSTLLQYELVSTLVADGTDGTD